MKNRKTVPAAMACIAIGVITLTWAQQASAADPKPSAAQPQPDQQQRDQASELRQTERSAQQARFHLDRASKEILNKQVVNRQDEKLGKIEELAVDADRGVVAYTILDVGGFLGIGGKQVAVPFQALNLEHQAGTAAARETRIDLDMDKERLTNAPGAFDKDAWPEMTNTQLARDIHRHYSVRPYWEMERGIARGERGRDLRGEPISPQEPGQATEEQRQERERALARMPGKKILKMEAELLNRDVRNQAKEDIGDVRDFLVDHDTGDIAFVVVEFNEKSNVLQEDKGKKFAALPFQLVEFRKEEGDKGAFMLTTNIDRVRGQLFSNDQWPKLNERDWVLSVYRHYDIQPYWGTVNITREQRGVQREEQQQRDQQQNQQNNPQQ